ncbi:unnamed protein product [Effrenium voratum]|uniref:Uncharacterized protein n=1 Tax=Effrenium voratum TaxID=2562239 RepID=A0AA36NND9_9DINO|nr:unnamed protein product [Effrenium voratum]
MTTPGQKLIQELQGIQAFLRTQQKCLGQHWDGVRQSQMESMKQKLHNLSGMSIEESTECSKLIGEGPWTEEQAQQLCLQVSPKEGRKLRQKRENQECVNFSAFLSQGDVAILETPCSLASKLQLAAVRCASIGLQWPNESTCGHVVSTLRHLGTSGLSDGKLFLEAVRDFKRFLKSASKQWPCADGVHIIKYPDSPAGLPEPVRQKAYANDAPAGCTAQPSGSMVLRKSNKMARPTSAEALQPSSGIEMSGINSLLGMLMQMQNAQADVGLKNLQVFTTKAAPALPQPEKSDTTPAAKALTPPEESPPQNQEQPLSPAEQANQLSQSGLKEKELVPMCSRRRRMKQAVAPP